MDLGLIAALAVGYAVISEIGKAAKRRAAARPATAALPRRTGRAPESLEELLAEMINRQSVEQAPVTTTTVATRGWREESLERPVTEIGREPVDLDSESFAAAARRRQQVETRNDARRPEDHESFDKRIRAAPLPVTPHDDGLGPLRHALIWNEVLGLPKGLQPD